MRKGFTLLELSVALMIIFILATLGFGAFSKARLAAYQAKSTSNLRQLGLATQFYLNDHDSQFFNYRLNADGGTTWWYGWESVGSLGESEGARVVDKTKSPLFAYLNQVGGVEICPGFDYASPNWKPKYQGATYGYGYNVVLSYSPASPKSPSEGWNGGVPYRLVELSSLTRVPVFATCAQINSFQGGATAKNPKIEEFPGFDAKEYVIHGRFSKKALVQFADGHGEGLELDPKALDSRIPAANIGRLPAATNYK